jgi:hypothetical protein
LSLYDVEWPHSEVHYDFDSTRLDSTRIYFFSCSVCSLFIRLAATTISWQHDLSYEIEKHFLPHRFVEYDLWSIRHGLAVALENDAIVLNTIGVWCHDYSSHIVNAITRLFVRNFGSYCPSDSSGNLGMGCYNASCYIGLLYCAPSQYYATSTGPPSQKPRGTLLANSNRDVYLSSIRHNWTQLDSIIDGICLCMWVSASGVCVGGGGGDV